MKKNVLKARIDKEFDKLNKEKNITLEQIHQKYKNKKLVIENNYKKEVSLNANPNILRARSSYNKIMRPIKTQSGFFSKLSDSSKLIKKSIDASINSTINNSSSSKLNLKSFPEKITINLKKEVDSSKIIPETQNENNTNNNNNMNTIRDNNINVNEKKS